MIQEASITGLLNTIFVIILIYYVIKIASRIFGPMLLKYAVRKVEKKVGAQSNAGNNTNRTQTKTEEKNKPSTEELGDYIDYEEID